MTLSIDGNARAGSRTPLNKDIALFSKQGLWLSGTLTDVSFGGAMVNVDSGPLSLAMDLTLVVIYSSETRADEYYALDTRIVRKDQNYIGVEFIRYDEQALSCLRRIYREALQ